MNEIWVWRIIQWRRILEAYHEKEHLKQNIMVQEPKKNRRKCSSFSVTGFLDVSLITALKKDELLLESFSKVLCYFWKEIRAVYSFLKERRQFITTTNVTQANNGWTKQFEKVPLEKELKKLFPSYALLSLVLVF